VNRFTLSDTDNRNYIVSAVLGFVVVVLVNWIWPSVIPFGTFELWGISGGVTDWMISSWPIFAWAAGVTVIVEIFSEGNWYTVRNAESEILLPGVVISIWAGVMEEICFRWLIFLSAIVGAKVTNFIFFGFLGFGVPEWFYLTVMGPIANFFTMGGLEDWLFHPASWAVGVAVLSANGFFRAGHKYQGIVGFVNSWFIGMFLFYIMFTYGLLAAILVHFLYDLLIFVLHYLSAVLKQAVA
jgi:hypothetical protein